MTAEPIDYKKRYGAEPKKFEQIVIAYAEFWQRNKQIPDLKSLVAKCPGLGPKTVGRVMEHPFFRQVMEERGIPVWKKTEISPLQHLAIQILVNPNDKRAVADRLRGIGVSYATYRNWLRDPNFYNYINGMAEDGLVDHNPDVMVALQREAMSGNMKAIEYFMEISGRYNRNKIQQVDVGSILMQVVEVISTHVKDQVALGHIAAEFRERFSGMATGEGTPRPAIEAVPQVLQGGAEVDYSDVKEFDL